MGWLLKVLLLAFCCLSKVVKSEDKVDSIGTLESIREEARAVRENLTERVNALAAYLSESVSVMKSMESRFIQMYRRSKGTKLNKTDLFSAGSNGGAVYTRWGKDSCSDEAELAYRGFAASGHYSHKGGGSNIICVHGEPQFQNTYPHNTSTLNYLYGLEYENIWRSDVTNQDAPCAVCRSLTRTTAILVPGRHSCMVGWHTEYWGFMVGPSSGDAGNAEYICLDSDPDSIEGGYQSNDGRTLYNVVYQCGSLPCPPYKTNYFAPCAVCTK